ncbi:MAG: hypothetical protein IPP13_09455 [Kouleothrix sp.]|nr:hypothetical protein [Kouleothrix sp.]
MNHESADRRGAAMRLLQALDPSDDLGCDHARELLPAFVEAEAAGVDVDGEPAYAAVLQHLDRCADCMAAYAQLAEDLAAMLDADDAAARVPLTPPSFFVPVRHSAQVLLRLLGGLGRAFQLDLQVRLPLPGSLSGGEHVTVFSDTLPEIAGAPVVAVSLALAAAGAPAELIVAVRELDAPTHWEVQLTVGGTLRAARTDDRGIARFELADLQAIDTLQISCREIGT